MLFFDLFSASQSFRALATSLSAATAPGPRRGAAADCRIIAAGLHRTRTDGTACVLGGGLDTARAGAATSTHVFGASAFSLGDRGPRRGRRGCGGARGGPVLRGGRRPDQAGGCEQHRLRPEHQQLHSPGGGCPKGLQLGRDRGHGAPRHGRGAHGSRGDHVAARSVVVVVRRRRRQRDTARRPGRRGDRVQRELAMSCVSSRVRLLSIAMACTVVASYAPVAIASEPDGGENRSSTPALPRLATRRDRNPARRGCGSVGCVLSTAPSGAPRARRDRFCGRGRRVCPSAADRAP